MTDRVLLHLSWPNRALSPNGRPHHMERWRKARAYRKEADWEAHIRGIKNLPKSESYGIKYFAYFKGTRPDRDNFIASMKAAQDGIAAAMGVDDKIFRTPEVVFERAKERSVLVEVST